jgi:hypothetical protein
MVSYLTEDEAEDEVPIFIPKQKQVQQTPFLRKRLETFVPSPPTVVSTKVAWKEDPLSDSEEEKEDSDEDSETPSQPSMTPCTMFLLCALVLSMSIVPPLVVSLAR